MDKIKQGTNFASLSVAPRNTTSLVEKAIIIKYEWELWTDGFNLSNATNNLSTLV